MKHGVLIINGFGFFSGGKFKQIYDMLRNTAAVCGARLDFVHSDILAMQAHDGFPSLGKPDFTIFWDKDVTLAKLLEKAGFRLFNSARTVEICDSKVLTALELWGKIPMPKTLFSPKTFVGYDGDCRFVQRAVEILGLPLVIKEACGSFGEQVYLAKTIDEATQIVLKLAGKDFVMQQFIAESAGKDIRLNVVGGKVVNAILRRGRSGDFRSNITLGGTAEKYVPSPEEIRIAEAACAAVGADFCGVDVLFGKDGPLLCEINSNFHFKSTLDATGVDLSENIIGYILETCG